MNGERVFLLDNPEQIIHFGKFLSHQDLPLHVLVRQYVAHRSNKQNARLWKLHQLASEVTGYSPEDMHEFSLCRHFGFTEQTIGKITRRVPLKRSSQRDKKEFAAFMEQTEIWYSEEFGVFLGQDD